MLGLHAIGVLLAPLLMWQGRAVRRRTPELAEPPGPRRGHCGVGTALKLLVLGDSAAAGVGAVRQDEALAMRLAHRLGEDFRVEWEILAQTGETTASMLRRLQQVEPIACDIVITSLGVNDVTRPIGLRAWRRQQRVLRQILRQRLHARLSILSGLPPMHLFPALPQPLRWYLGQRANCFDRALEADVAAEADCAFLSLRFSDDMSLAARDGFHPGPAVYAQWASLAAELVLANFKPGQMEATR